MSVTEGKQAQLVACRSVFGHSWQLPDRNPRSEAFGNTIESLPTCVCSDAERFREPCRGGALTSIIMSGSIHVLTFPEAVAGSESV